MITRIPSRTNHERCEVQHFHVQTVWLYISCTLTFHSSKTLWSVHLGVVVAELINCKCGGIQGVPKVLSSNFMHYTFWSKLYFYMKFLEDVYFSIKYMYSESQWLACPFCFFITFCSRCGMKWDTACWPTNDPFWAFLSPGAQDPVQPPNKICLV